MNKILLYYSIAVTGLLICFVISTCERGPIVPNGRDSVYIFKTIIEKHTDTVERLKTIRGKIEYRTKFDTLATIDTVLVELLKADTIIKIDKRIILMQDTIVHEQARIIEIQGDSINTLNDELKKEKRKVRFFKATTVIALLLHLIH